MRKYSFAAALQARSASGALYLSSMATASTVKPFFSLRFWPPGPSFQYFGVPVRKESCGTPAPVSGPCSPMRVTFLSQSMAVVVPSSPGDRNGVVEGKGVSVRVDLGGGRILPEKQFVK